MKSFQSFFFPIFSSVCYVTIASSYNMIQLSTFTSISLQLQASTEQLVNSNVFTISQAVQFFCGASGQGCLTVEACRSHTPCRIPLNESSAHHRDHYLHNTQHMRQTSMPSGALETMIPAIKWL